MQRGKRLLGRSKKYSPPPTKLLRKTSLKYLQIQTKDAQAFPHILDLVVRSVDRGLSHGSGSHPTQTIGGLVTDIPKGPTRKQFQFIQHQHHKRDEPENEEENKANSRTCFSFTAKTYQRGNENISGSVTAHRLNVCTADR